MNKKRTRNEWTLPEVRTLREKYESASSIEELHELLPRHTPLSIMMYAQTQLRLKRPPHRNRHTPGWDRIKDLLKDRQLTMQQIADALEVSKPSVSECLRLHRADWHIADRIPRRGMHTWIIALGSGEDAPVDLCAKTLSHYSKARPNPFLVAAGVIEPHQTVSGRVIKHDMAIHGHDELEEA
ncbi:helix-turn-helix domain-containing protein [Burkholderia cepacia]|uniref:helix-turn-helix domain-containing protein n=1 Tax=Burkholderia cepacia TaxID=292 RepID=UPI001F3D9C51|nr:helix-turn-helix domain-containing protein [Burkholderia cepacia]UIY58129.1 helix-turn-helix domain-containing protein [Burkholderia cepacia]